MEEQTVVDTSLDFDFNPVIEETEVEETHVEVPVAEEVMPEPVVAEDPHIKSIIDKELEELFGEEKEFTYKSIGEQYVITFDDGSTVELDKEYINLLS
jgi:hypothetical protein